MQRLSLILFIAAGMMGCNFLDLTTGGTGIADNDEPPPEIHGCFYDYECGDGLYCGRDHQCHTPPQCANKVECEELNRTGCFFDQDCGADRWCNDAVCEDIPKVLDPCSTWSGPTSGGNDSESVFAMEICRDANDPSLVKGKSTTTSPQSGFSERIIEGRILNEEHLELEMWETGITVDNPNPGWRFCTADRYDLRLRVDKLVGTFVSAECNDDGWVLLSLPE